MQKHGNKKQYSLFTNDWWRGAMTIITFTIFLHSLSHLIQDSHEIITASILQMRKPRQESQASVPVTEEEIKPSSTLYCILFH